MKKYLATIMFVALGILLVSSMVTAGINPGTGIKATSHDLSSTSGKGNSYGAGTAADPTLDRICIYCHAPHHTLKTADATAAGISYYPLWNHQLSSIASYTPYSNGLNGTASDITDLSHKLNHTAGQPGGVSKLCLSCHDGSVSVNQYGYSPASSRHNGTAAGLLDATSAYGIGIAGNLQNHHPIGFNYASVASVDDEIADPTTPLNTILTINDALWAGRMECTTCHDVHNTKNEGEKFLWASDANSKFCLTCHVK